VVSCWQVVATVAAFAIVGSFLHTISPGTSARKPTVRTALTEATCFRNPDSERVNVIYHRPDGHLGLIEPEPLEQETEGSRQ